MAIREEVLNMSKLIQEIVSLEGDTITNTDGVYNKTLPENLTPVIVTEVRKHDVNFIAASAHAVGAIAVKAMADGFKDPITGTFEMSGEDKKYLSATHTMSHAVPGQGGFGNATETEPRKTSLHTTIHAKSGKAAGQLKAVRADLEALAVASFK